MVFTHIITQLQGLFSLQILFYFFEAEGMNMKEIKEDEKRHERPLKKKRAHLLFTLNPLGDH